jgi:hypothetical protein
MSPHSTPLPLVDYIIARSSDLPPIRAAMYEYVLAGNGVFVRGSRTGLLASIKVFDCQVKGLAQLQQSFHFDYPKVPSSLLATMLLRSRQVSAGLLEFSPKEILFHLYWDGLQWQLEEPRQLQSSTSCKPLGSSLDSSYERALIEVHSHHWMQASFSSTDDSEETGFRIFVVLGEIFTLPTIRVRIGLYHHFLEIPAESIFCLPEKMTGADNPNIIEDSNYDQ